MMRLKLAKAVKHLKHAIKAVAPAGLLSIFVIGFIAFSSLKAREGQAIAAFFPSNLSERQIMTALYRADARLIGLGKRQGQVIVSPQSKGPENREPENKRPISEGLIARLRDEGAWLLLSAQGAMACGAIEKRLSLSE